MPSNIMSLSINSKGYSQHGDYVFGWKDDSLQRAMDARCNNDVCTALKSQTADEAMKCTKAQMVNDDLEGCKSGLLLMGYCQNQQY